MTDPIEFESVLAAAHDTQLGQMLLSRTSPGTSREAAGGVSTPERKTPSASPAGSYTLENDAARIAAMDDASGVNE